MKLLLGLDDCVGGWCCKLDVSKTYIVLLQCMLLCVYHSMVLKFSSQIACFECTVGEGRVHRHSPPTDTRTGIEQLASVPKRTSLSCAALPPCEEAHLLQPGPWGSGRAVKRRKAVDCRELIRAFVALLACG